MNSEFQYCARKARTGLWAGIDSLLCGVEFRQLPPTGGRYCKQLRRFSFSLVFIASSLNSPRASLLKIHLTTRMPRKGRPFKAAAAVALAAGTNNEMDGTGNAARSMTPDRHRKPGVCMDSFYSLPDVENRFTIGTTNKKSAKRYITHPRATVVYNTCRRLFRRRLCTPTLLLACAI